MKKILFVIESLYLGGAEKSLISLLQNLDYSLYNVDLITFKEGELLQFLPKEVNYIKLEFPKLNLWDRFQYRFQRNFNKTGHNAQMLWPFLQPFLKVRTKSYDVAIAYSQGFSTYYVSEFILADKKISWLNTDYEKAKYAINFDMPFYNNFNKIIAVSREAAESFKKALPDAEKKIMIEVIKDVTDEEIVRRQSEAPLKIMKEENNIYIVSVGRLVYYKGFHLAINACEILVKKKYNVKWYVIGEGNERNKLEKQINKLGLKNNFFLLGSDTNPYPYMRACDIYVQTSLFEGLGLTVVEASILNKPIVCTNFPTSRSLIKNEQTGLISEMKPESIAHNIERLIVDEMMRSNFAINLSKHKNRDKENTLNAVNKLLNT